MQVPKHIAIIMDGNGRWAKKRLLPRVAGHVKGVIALKKIVQYCDDIKVKHLTVFAFGRENWNRPADEVSFLMNLMFNKLDEEIEELNQKNAKISFIGDRTRLQARLIQSIDFAENKTKDNDGLNFNICLDYSGQYDIIQAVNKHIDKNPNQQITEELLEGNLLLANQPNPELLIRTSGEYRISNFLLWQLAYSEMYFTDVFWPSFSSKTLDDAIHWFNTKERRFGKISEQLADG